MNKSSKTLYEIDKSKKGLMLSVSTNYERERAITNTDHFYKITFEKAVNGGNVDVGIICHPEELKKKIREAKDTIRDQLKRLRLSSNLDNCKITKREFLTHQDYLEKI